MHAPAIDKTLGNILVNKKMRQLVSSDEAKELYRDLRKVMKGVSVEDPSVDDKNWVKKTLAVLLVTKPINKDAPFEVERFVNEDLRGTDFKVDSYKLSARDTMAGGRYDIEILAFSKERDFYYEFKGSLMQNKPYLRVDEATLDVTSERLRE